MRLFSVLALNLCFAPVVYAATITVGSGADCDAASLETALAGASLGDVIAMNGENFPNTNAEIEFDLAIRGGGQACESIGAVQSRASLVGTPGANTAVLRVRFGAIARLTGLALSGGSGANGAGLWVDVASRVDANDLSIHDNLANHSGGGVYVATAATLSVATGMGVSEMGIEVRSNQAADGGGIYIGPNGSLILDAPGSLIAANNANRGGGIQVSPTGSFELGEVGIEDHIVAGNGGGIYVESGPGNPNVLRLTASTDTIINNNQAGNGGGLYFESGSQCNAELGAHVHNNSADNTGGGIAVAAGSCKLSLIGAQISNNSANALGGGISLSDGGSFDLLGSSVSGNTARDGAGIEGLNATIRLNDALVNGVNIGSSLIANQALDDGGGLRISGTGSVLLVGATGDGCTPVCRIANNTAGRDGAGVWADEAYVELHSGTEITANMAIGNGGGYWGRRGSLFSFAGKSAAIATRILANTAGGDGGGLYLHDLGAALSWIEIGASELGNNAGDDGGGLFAIADQDPNAQIRLFNSLINHNGAIGDGGGVFSAGRSISFQADLANDDVVDDTPDCLPASLPFNRYCAELIGNVAGSTGGAIRVSGDAGLVIQGTAIRANQSPVGAGIWTSGASPISLRQTLIADNSSEGLFMQFGSNLGIADASWVNNVGTAVSLNAGDTIVAQIDRSLIWGNGGGLQANGNVALSSECNNSQDNSLSGISVAPSLGANARGDYHYAIGSAGVDSCNNGPVFDLDGVERPLGSAWDIGSYEGQYSPFVDPVFADQFESN